MGTLLSMKMRMMDTTMRKPRSQPSPYTGTMRSRRSQLVNVRALFRVCWRTAHSGLCFPGRNTGSESMSKKDLTRRYSTRENKRPLNDNLVTKGTYFVLHTIGRRYAKRGITYDELLSSVAALHTLQHGN